MSKNRSALVVVLALASISGFAHAGTGVWTSGGPYGGVAQSIVIDPANPANLYVALNNGGLYKSTDSGATWKASYPLLTFDLAIDPTTSTTLYAGTNSGVYKTTDAGATWVQMNTGVTATPSHLAIDPNMSSTLYVGSSNGVFKSTNSGTTWAAASTGLSSLFIRDLVVDPTASSTLYVGTNAGGVYKSTDSGGTWAAANTGLTSATVLALAIDPISSATLYAGTDGGGVSKSTNAGGTWSATNTGLAYPFVSALAVDPLFPTTLYAGTNGGGTFKSTNAGGTWSAASVGLTAPWVLTLAIDPTSPATLYAGTDHSGGVFKSTNSGGAWTASNSGLTAFLVSCLVVDQALPATIYAGANGGVFRSTNSGSSWAALNAGLTNPVVQALALDATTSTTLYAGTSTGVFKSTDSGSTWAGTSSGLTTLFVLSLSIDPTTPATVYAGTNGGGVFRSTDSGANWAVTNTGLTALVVSTLAIDSVAPVTLYAGTSSGGVFKSTNSGVLWVPANTGLTNLNARALAIDPATPATVYAGTSGGGVFKSADSAGSWAANNTGLTNLTVSALDIHPTTPATLYAGTGFGGVFKSTNSGGTWAAINAGLDSTSLRISAVALDPTGPTTVYAGLSNSVWQLTPDVAAPTNPTSLVSTTHAASTWTNAGSIGMQWTGAADSGGSGLAGYSVLFDTAATTGPDSAVEVPQAGDPHSTSSAPLSDGIYYFHLRTCDLATNCSDAIHSGPYWIDRTSPGAPTGLNSTSHQVNLPSFDHTIDIAWSASLDVVSGGVFSDIDGYSVFFDATPASACDFSKDVEENTLSATSPRLPAGTWYAHVCAVDNAGNWSSLASTGPYILQSATLELAHGVVWRGSLAAKAGQPDMNWFPIRMEPYASYEVVMDEAPDAFGASEGPLLQRMAADAVTIVQPSQAVGVGPSQSLRWMNTSSVVRDAEAVRVANTACSSTCNDVYRLRAYETTEQIARFNNSASQITVVILQNPTTQPVQAKILFWSPAGALLDQVNTLLAAHGSLNLNTSTVAGLQGQGGTITVMHDAPYGALVGKAVALEPASGFTFDSVMTSRQR